MDKSKWRVARTLHGHEGAANTRNPREGDRRRRATKEKGSVFALRWNMYSVHSVQSGENQSGPASRTEQERKAKGNIPKIVDKFANSGQQAK